MAMSGSSGLRAASFGTTSAAAQRLPPTREWRRLSDFPGSTAVRHKRPAGSRDTRAETLLFPASAARPGRLLPGPVLWRPPNVIKREGGSRRIDIQAGAKGRDLGA